MTDSRTSAGDIHLLVPEHLLVSENKADFKQNKTKQKHNSGAMSKWQRSQLKELPIAKAEKICATI